MPRSSPASVVGDTTPVARQIDKAGHSCNTLYGSTGTPLGVQETIRYITGYYSMIASSSSDLGLVGTVVHRAGCRLRWAARYITLQE